MVEQRYCSLLVMCYQVMVASNTSYLLASVNAGWLVRRQFPRQKGLSCKRAAAKGLICERSKTNIAMKVVLQVNDGHNKRDSRDLRGRASCCCLAMQGLRKR